MTVDPDEEDAKVFRLPVRRDRADPADPDAEVDPSDTSFEIALDDEDNTPAVVVPVDAITSPKVTHQPIIPGHLRGKAAVAATTKRIVGRTTHSTAYHFVRTPKYFALALLWSVVGLFRAFWQQVRWWWVSEATSLRHGAVDAKDGAEWQRLHKETKHTRRTRGRWLLVELGALAGGVFAAFTYAPWWVPWVVVAVLVPILAHIGRPVDKPIISTAVVTHRYRTISADVVLRAYYAAKLGDPDKPNQQIMFGSTMSRDPLNAGSQVIVDLPYGKTFSDALKAREAIASGLDVALSQVYLSRDKTSNRRHLLWVADVDPLSIPAGRTPLLDCKARDIWRPAPLGLDERGQRVLLPLVFYSVLIGSQPRKGKALALDTVVPTPSCWTTMGELNAGDTVFDESGNPSKVLHAWPVQYNRPCYEIHFSDGSIIVADAEHLWSVDTRSSRLGKQQRGAHKRNISSPFSNDQSHRWALPQVITTEGMIGSVRIQADQRANYSVRVSAPLQADSADLSIDPYLLGLWLGDGTTTAGVLTLNREDAPEIESRLVGDFHHVPSGDRPGSVSVRCDGLTVALRSAGVLGYKHIPVCYMRASESQRRALLAGLLDSDGYCQSTGVVYFAVTSERLANDVRHLVSTLGYKSSLNVKPVKLNGRDLGYQWVVTFTPADKVFGLTRKAARQVTSMKASAGHRFITEIRPVHSVPVRCITVDSPNSLYLVGETCIPTHNSFSGRLLALFAALDPFTRLSVFDGKGSPDWRKFALVSHTYGFGLLPDRLQGEPVANLLATLRAMKHDVMDRNARLAELPTSVCPEGKLTRDIARDPKYKMPVWVIILDEFQEYLNTGDDEVDREIAELLVFAVKVGPSVGVIPISLTQRPSGIGSTGKVAKLFIDFRDNHLTRFALKTGSWQVSDLILGAGAYSEGFDSSALPVGDEYRGVGILYDAPVEDCTVRAFLADNEDAEKILHAARALRERAGTLDGMAAGEEIAVQARDPLTDVYDVLLPGETWVSWNRLAERLAETMPERYAKVTPKGISSTLTALKLGIESRDGRCDSIPSGVTKGVHRAALDRAIERRNRETNGS